MNQKRRLLFALVTVLLLSAGGWNSAVSQPCTHSVILYDSFGDGWTTFSTPAYHYLTVRVNGVAVLTDITLTTGSTSTPFTFSASSGDIISTTFTDNGFFEGECSYTILDNVGTPLATAGPTSLTSVTANCAAAPSACDFIVTMTDDFGDGWNGASLTIVINGVPTYTGLAVPAGSYGPTLYSFTTNHGDVVRVTFNSGSWDGECYYTIKQAGAVVFSDGVFGSYISPTANNALVGTGNCPVDIAVEDVLLDYADGYWATRVAPNANAVRAVFNVGSANGPGSVTAVYKVGSAPTSVSDGVAETFNPTWNGGIAEVEFTQRVDNLAPQVYGVYVATFLNGDPNPTNDVYGSPFAAYDVEMKGLETFEDCVNPAVTYDGYFDRGWTTTDLNGGSTWEIGPYGGNTALMHPGGEAANDWIFTPAALLDQNSSYRLQGSMATGGSSAKTIELAYGLSPDPAAMTVFATFSGFSNTSYMNFKDIAGNLFDPYFNTTAGPVSVYIGIHLTSASTDPVYIEYLSLNDNPTPPPIIGYALPGSSLGSYIDDPSIPIVVSANYKSPGKINKTYSVANTTDMYGTNGDFLWDVETTTPWITLTKSMPNPTLQSYNFSPPRPLQFQTFTMTVDPAGMAPGTYTGDITFYGVLFNDEFPPPASGLVAINEPFVVPVELRISSAGTKGGPQSLCYTIPSAMTAGNVYPFMDPATGERIAEVEVTGGQIDNMTICVYPKQLPQNITRLRYVERYWTIDAAGASWTADVTFPYSDQEISMVSDLYQLRGIRQPSPLAMWENPINGTSSVSTPSDNSVTVVGLNQSNHQGFIALGHPYFIITKNDNGAIPTEMTLSQNFPNPFNPSTTISFGIPEEGTVRLKVVDLFGREVATLVNDVKQAGFHTAAFDASAITSGTYMYTLEWNGMVISRQMTLMK